MAYSAKSIANYFLEKAHQEKVTDITPMKLLKLVYIAHGWWLGFTEKPLINEQVEAWKFGPVIPSLYHEFKHFGMSPITSKATELEFPSWEYEEVPVPSGGEVIKLLDAVWESYGKYNGVQLSNLTHITGSPWERTKKEYGGVLPRGTDIDRNLIEDFYKERIKAIQAKTQKT